MQTRRVRGAPVFVETSNGTVSVVEELEVVEGTGSVSVRPAGLYLIDDDGVRRLEARRSLMRPWALVFVGALAGWLAARAHGRVRRRR